jgi:hypothetical protein
MISDMNAMNENDFMLVVERFYKEINPDSKMDVPSHVYETFRSWYDQWVASRCGATFYQWVLINKKK